MVAVSDATLETVAVEQELERPPGDSGVGKIHCPLCGEVLTGSRSAVCRRCGLWWIANPDESFQGDASFGGPTEPLALILRESFLKYVILDLFFLAVGLLGFGAVLAVVWNVTQAPSEWTAWAKLAIGLPLGGWAGIVGIALVAGRLVRQVHPSSLAGDRIELHVIAWNTWEDFWKAFRRSDRRIPRSQVRGVAFSVGQGGDLQLFLLHSSGLSFATGWSGTRVQGMRHKDKILSWLSN